MMKLNTLLFFTLIYLIMNGCDTKKEQGANQTQTPIENILSRKSVRKYTDQPVEKEKVQLLLRAAMAAPSGKDNRPWEFVVVNDRASLDSMAAALPYAKMLKQAQLAIVVCGNMERSSYWYLDCSLAAQNILLAAESLGLGAVWTASYPYPDRMEAVKACIALPDSVESLCVIPIGYPAMPHQPKDKWDETKIHYNKF